MVRAGAKRMMSPCVGLACSSNTSHHCTDYMPKLSVVIMSKTWSRMMGDQWQADMVVHAICHHWGNTTEHVSCRSWEQLNRRDLISCTPSINTNEFTLFGMHKTVLLLHIGFVPGGTQASLSCWNAVSVLMIDMSASSLSNLFSKWAYSVPLTNNPESLSFMQTS